MALGGHLARGPQAIGRLQQQLAAQGGDALCPRGDGERVLEAHAALVPAPHVQAERPSVQLVTW